MSELRYGFIIPNGEANEIVTMAREAKDTGWDGVFYWDGIYIESAGPMFDPWAMLAAIASQTSRVRIGAMLTPVSRRRPWKLARETMTVDRISGGRLVLPVRSRRVRRWRLRQGGRADRPQDAR